MAAFTQEQRMRFVRDVQEKVKAGTPKGEACKEVGISLGSYQVWTKTASNPYTKVSKRPANPASESAPVASPITFEIPSQDTPMVILIGNSADVGRALDRLASIHGGRQ